MLPSVVRPLNPGVIEVLQAGKASDVGPDIAHPFQLVGCSGRAPEEVHTNNPTRFHAFCRSTNGPAGGASTFETGTKRADSMLQCQHRRGPDH